MNQLPEVWLRGPLPQITPTLQPVGHALLQSVEEVLRYTHNFPPSLLWLKPGGMASVGFHLLHLTGVLDRLFSYAGGRQLSPAQLEYLQKESLPHPDLTVTGLVAAFEKQIEASLSFLAQTDPASLNDHRAVGRKALPSTTLGLLFHAAEHTQRHVGQLLVTIAFVKALQP